MSPRAPLPGGMRDRLPDVHQITRKGGIPPYASCHYCDAPATTKDHVVARSKRGSDAWWNLVPSCVECQQRKGNGATWCSCAFCRRAIDLWTSGYRLQPLTGERKPVNIPPPLPFFPEPHVPQERRESFPGST